MEGHSSKQLDRTLKKDQCRERRGQVERLFLTKGYEWEYKAGD